MTAVVLPGGHDLDDPFVPLPLPAHLLEAREELLQEGVPANTRRTYQDVLRRFDEWCADYGQQAYPVTEDALSGYITHLAREKNCMPSTLLLTVTVIASRERVMGNREVPEAWLDKVTRMIRGHARTRAGEEGAAEAKAYPLVRKTLVEVATACEQQGWRSTLRGKRDALLISIGWSLAMRESELCNLRVRDVEDLGTGLKVRISTSKTDTMSRGVYRTIPQGTFAPLEPVSLLQDYLDALREVVRVEPGDPLFRAITRHGKPYTAQTVSTKDGRECTYGGLSVRAFDDILRAVCRMGQMRSQSVAMVSGHSLRAGYATTCAWERLPQGIWSRWGRWEPTSNIPSLYVRDAGMEHECPLDVIGF